MKVAICNIYKENVEEYYVDLKAFNGGGVVIRPKWACLRLSEHFLGFQIHIFFLPIL